MLFQCCLSFGLGGLVQLSEETLDAVRSVVQLVALRQ